MTATSLASAVLLLASCGCPCPESTNLHEPSRETLRRAPIAQQCAADPENSHDADVELLGNLGIVRLSADAFVNLSADERKMALELTNAVRAADPIIYDQRHPQGLAVKILADEIALHLDALPPELRSNAESFVRIIFANKGPRDASSGGRLSFNLTRAELETAAVAALKHGATFDGNATEPALKAWMGKLLPALFDDRSPAHAPRLDRIEKRHAQQIVEIAAALRRARTLATPSQQRLLDLQIIAIESNTEEARAAYLAEWAASSLPLDIAIGFLGPVTASGEREFVAPLFLSSHTPPSHSQKSLNTLREAFEIASPRTTSKQPTRLVVDTPLVMGSRTIAPIIPYPETEPAKLLIAPAATTATLGLTSAAGVQAFHQDPAGEADVRQCIGTLHNVLIMAHAVASERAAKPATASLAVIARVLSDATILASPESFVSNGLPPDCGRAGALGDAYLVSYLMYLGGLAADPFVMSAAAHARSIVVSYALERGAAVEIARDGYSFLRISRLEAWAQAMERLRNDAGEILEQGDRVRAERLTARRNALLEQRLVRSAKDRLRSLGLPTALVWQPPLLKAIRDESGNVQDVTLDEGSSWIEASLVWAGRLRKE